MHDSKMHTNDLATLSDLHRRFHNVIKIGRIFEVDLPHQQLRVKLESELHTGWLPIPGEVTKNYTRWRPLEIGTNVMIACESGDLRNAAIIQIFYSGTRPAPSDSESLDLIQFIDGAELSYDTFTHEMVVKAADGGRVNITAKAGEVNVDADDGKISAQANNGEVSINAPNGTINAAALLGKSIYRQRVAASMPVPTRVKPLLSFILVAKNQA